MNLKLCGFSILILIFFSIQSYAQKQTINKYNSTAVYGSIKNGKVTPIFNATEAQITYALSGEHNMGRNGYVKFDKNANFKMFFEHQGTDIEVLRRINKYGSWKEASTPSYTRTVSGNYTLIKANKDVNQNKRITDRYGDYVETKTSGYYIGYWIILNGIDNRGNSQTMCGAIVQNYDERYIYGWKVEFRSDADCSCYCNTGAPSKYETYLGSFKLIK